MTMTSLTPTSFIPAGKPHEDVASVPLAAGAEPERDLRFGLIVAIAFFVLFLGWAAFFRLDAAASGQGAVIVASQRQAVQHLEGGTVSRLLVHEGERVTRGQVLIELDDSQVRATERGLASQAIRLSAQKERLEAVLLGKTSMNEPAMFQGLTGDDRVEADLAMRLERRELGLRSSLLAANRGVFSARRSQAGSQSVGMGEQARATREQMRIVDEQIAQLAPLAADGFVSQTRMRELERARSELQGRMAQYDASRAQSLGGVAEGRSQLLQSERGLDEQAASNLTDVNERLGTVLPAWTAARSQLARMIIRAPASGAVLGLAIFNKGGVIAPGQRLMEIVPDGAELLLRAQFPADDINDLTVGKSTLVRFTGLHERTMPQLNGKVIRVAADSLVNDKTGIAYISCDVIVPHDQLQLIRSVRGKDFVLRPGMPVQVLVPLRKRTALDYLLDPLVGSFWGAFREH